MAEIIPDSAIYDFLTSKGVEVEPPKTNKDIKERLVDGAITGLNPLVGAANMGLKQMGKGSKQQEWTSWKQWALIHADWSNFWEEKKNYYLTKEAEEKERVRIEKEKKAAEKKAKIEAENKYYAEKRRKNLPYLIGFPLVFLVLFFIGFGVEFSNYLKCGSFTKWCPSSNQLRDTSYSEFIEAVKNNEVSLVFISPSNSAAEVVFVDGNRSFVNLLFDQDLLALLTKYKVDIRVQPSGE